MPKRKSSDRSLVKMTLKSTKNVYEDFDSERSDQEVFRSRDGRGSGFENDAGRRKVRKRGDDYSSDDFPYNSPRRDLLRDRRSPHGGVHEDYYGRRGRPDRHQDGRNIPRYGRDRSPPAETSYRESRVRHGQGRRYDSLEGRHFTWQDTYSLTRRSLASDDRRGRMKRSRSTPLQVDAEEMRGRSGARKRKIVKKPVQLDALGIPMGLMKDQFSKDINSFVKDMNPCIGYEKQKQKAKDRLHDRIYDDYEVHGEVDKVDEKYIKKCATKALITWQHTLNKALDTGDGKPPELSMKYWEELQRIRESEASKRKSQQMGNQVRKRGLRNTTKEKLKQAAVVKLVSERTELE